jgi:hypothetical protein
VRDEAGPAAGPTPALPPGPVAAALAAFRADSKAAGWAALPFFADSSAEAVAARVDRRIAEGATILPAPPDIFAALRLTPLDRVKAVILGQDPYPTPGDAHGLAFSYRGGRRLPPSLKVIFAELSADLGTPAPRTGDLSGWADAGRAPAQLGAHRGGREGGRASQARLVGPDGRRGRGNIEQPAGGRLPALGQPGADANGADRSGQAPRARVRPPLAA